MSFRSYRRRLPHWRLDRATYHVTWRLHPTQHALSPEERSIIVATLRHFEGERYALDAFVIMNDHVHIIVTPKSGMELERIVQSWKSFSAWRLQREFGRTGSVWQDEYYDRIVRNEIELGIITRYVLANPRRRWPELDSYPWVWSREGDKGEDRRD